MFHNLTTWIEDRRQVYLENTGAFYSSGRDPIIYAHHSNIDGMWHLWLTLPGQNRKGFDNNNWLNSSFIFWDENMYIARVRVCDSLDALKLGYTFQYVSIPWIDYKPLWPAEAVKKPELVKGGEVTSQAYFSNDSRSEEAAKKRRVLMVDNIKLMKGECVKFDLYVNAGEENEAIRSEPVHFVRSFVHLPMSTEREPMVMMTRLLLGLSELLSEINAHGDSSIMVSLIPRRGRDEVSVGDVRIELSS